MTTALLPGVSWVVLRTAPTPVMTPHARRHARSSPTSAGTGTSCDWSTTTDSAKPATPISAFSGWPARVCRRCSVMRAKDPSQEVRRAGQAGDASAARAEGARRLRAHPVGTPYHSGTDLLDNAGRFMPRHHGWRGRAPAKPVAADQVYVAVTDGDGGDPHPRPRPPAECRGPRPRPGAACPARSRRRPALVRPSTGSQPS